MNILVLMKEVPEMEKVKFDTESGRVNRASAEAEMNPLDVYALQAAVDLKKNIDVQITVLTMGPTSARRTLQDCWARGADKSILLSDRAFAGSDTYATAKILSAAIQVLDFDLILCGEKSVDGDTAQVGAEIAELLSIPHSYYVEQIKGLDQQSITVSTAGIAGAVQTRIMKLPALVSVDKSISSPQLPTLERKLESLDVKVESLGLNDLIGKITEEEAGLKGSPTKVAKVIVPKTEKRGSVIYKDDYNSFLEVLEKCLERVV